MPSKPVLLETWVTVNPYRHDGVTYYAIKIQTDAFELNVHVRSEEVMKFEQVQTRPWVRGSIRIGESAGFPAFWCVGDEGDNSVSILIGRDDETWDIAVSLPTNTIDVIRREIAACPIADNAT